MIGLLLEYAECGENDVIVVGRGYIVWSLTKFHCKAEIFGNGGQWCSAVIPLGIVNGLKDRVVVGAPLILSESCVLPQNDPVSDSPIKGVLICAAVHTSYVME